jgi:hypothetical protein
VQFFSEWPWNAPLLFDQVDRDRIFDDYVAAPQVWRPFDAVYYREHTLGLPPNADLATHYMTEGWRQGRNPSAWFDTERYLAANSDVAAAGVNPLVHYLQYGRAEGRLAFPVGRP